MKITESTNKWGEVTRYTDEFKAAVSFLHSVIGVSADDICRAYGISKTSVYAWTKEYQGQQILEKNMSGETGLATRIVGCAAGETSAAVYEDDSQIVIFCPKEKKSVKASLEEHGLKARSLEKADIPPLAGTFITLNKKSHAYKNFLMLAQDEFPPEPAEQESAAAAAESEDGIGMPDGTQEETAAGEESQETNGPQACSEDDGAVEDCGIQPDNPSAESSVRILEADTGREIEDKLYSIFCRIFNGTSRAGFRLDDFALGQKCYFHNGEETSSVPGNEYTAYYRDDGYGDFHISGFIRFIASGNIWIVDDSGNNLTSKFFLFARNRMRLPCASAYICSSITGNVAAIGKDGHIDEDILLSPDFRILEDGSTNAAALMARKREEEPEASDSEELDLTEYVRPYGTEEDYAGSDGSKEHAAGVLCKARLETIRKIGILRAILIARKIRPFKNNIDISGAGFSFMVRKGLLKFRWTSERIYLALSQAGLDNCEVDLRRRWGEYFFYIYVPLDCAALAGDRAQALPSRGHICTVTIPCRVEDDR